MFWKSEALTGNHKIKRFFLLLLLTHLMIWGMLVWLYDFELLVHLKQADFVEYFPNYFWLLYIYVQVTWIMNLLFFLSIPFILYFLFPLLDKLGKISILVLALLCSPTLIPSIKNLSKVKYQYSKLIHQNTYPACPAKPVSVDTNAKYNRHKSYAEFLNYLKSKIDQEDDAFKQADIIRQEVASLIDLGEYYTCLSNQSDNWSVFSQEKFYSLFMNDKASVYCGGSSLFLQHVFQDLNFHAERYDMGSSDASHQTTLVYMESTKQWYVQDAYFNGTLISKVTEEPVPFHMVLDENNHPDIRFRQDSYPYPADYLLEDKCQDIQGNWVLANHLGDTVYHLASNPDAYKYTSDRTLVHFILDSNINARYQALLGQQFTTTEFNQQTFLQLFLLPKTSKESAFIDSIHSIPNLNL